jgi:hypothetical protein
MFGILSEISQAQNAKHCMFLLIVELRSKMMMVMMTMMTIMIVGHE